MCDNIAVAIERLKETENIIENREAYLENKREELTEQGVCEEEIEEEIWELYAEYSEYFDIDGVVECVFYEEHVELPAVAAAKRLNLGDLVDSMSETSGFPSQCSEVSQPLKQFVLSNCMFSGRSFFPSQKISRRNVRVHVFGCEAGWWRDDLRVLLRRARCYLLIG